MKKILSTLAMMAAVFAEECGHLTDGYLDALLAREDFWGIAAFNPSRPAEVTALMHETALLTLVTTDQFYIFQMIAIVYVSLTQKTDPHSPFPRWMGYYTLWAALMFEVGAIAFLPKTGPFSWSGLFVFWCPFLIFFTWMTVLAVCLLRAISLQRRAEQRAPSMTSEALSETV